MAVFGYCDIFFTGEPTGISSKLDFGDPQPTASLRSSMPDSNIVSVDSPVKYTITTKTVESVAKPMDDFDDIGIVCVSGGCNKTKNSSDSGVNTVKTDVIVHVETKVNLNNENKTQVNDTPDVPIVLGVKGTKWDPNNGQDNPENPIYVTDPYSRSDFESSLDSNTRQDASRGFDFKPLEDIANVRGSYPVTNINDYSTPVVTTNDRNRYNYNSNGIEVQVPYFEPSFQNHYYGENPPQQLVWYPMRGGRYNNGNFGAFPKSSWRPSAWQPRYQNSNFRYESSTTLPIRTKSEDCACKTDHLGRSLNWYPSTSFVGGSPRNNDPGSQINDKLAPLNKRK